VGKQGFAGKLETAAPGASQPAFLCRPPGLDLYAPLSQRFRAGYARCARFRAYGAGV